MKMLEKKIRQKLFRYYETYMKFSREYLRLFAEHDGITDIENATKKELALKLAFNKFNNEDHYAK